MISLDYDPCKTNQPNGQESLIMTESPREEQFILPFLSAYENGTWADAILLKPDAIDRTHPAVDQLAIRKPDGKRLAIEHTIIQPFVGEKKDFAFFELSFLEIEKDKSLLVPGFGIEVYVPVGTLRNQRSRAACDAIVRSVHAWIKSNPFLLHYGTTKHSCTVAGIPGMPPYEISLTVKVVPLKYGPDAERGVLLLRRQQVDNNLGEVIEEALERKLPKLVNTSADKRILIFERQHINLLPLDMLHEIEIRNHLFPDVACVDEIWILETIGYGTSFGGNHFRFELYEGGMEVDSLTFNGSELI